MTAAAIYVRISQDRDETGLGVKRQERDCRTLAAKRRWDVVGVYCDNDVSATSRKPRPEYTRMIEAVESGSVSAIVVWDVDRLTRTPRELEDVIDYADRKGLQLASVGGEFDIGTEQGRMMARLKGAVARYEVEQTSRRAKAKHAEKAERGLPSGGGTRPYGFESDMITHRPHEAAVLREACGMILDGGSLRQTARTLNERGERTSTGRAWTGEVLKKVLTRPRVAGYRDHRGQLHEAVWQPIIDRSSWERLCAELGSAGRRPLGPNSRRHTWTGLLRCGRCDGLMGARMVNGKMSYSCRSSHRDRWHPGSHGCQGVSIRQEAADSVLDELLLRRVETADLGEPEAVNERDDLDDEIAALEDRLDSLADAFADGALDTSAYQLASRKVSIRLETKRLERNAARRRSAVVVALDPYTVRESWADLPAKERRALAGAFVSKVVVAPTARRGDTRFNPERLTVVWC